MPKVSSHPFPPHHSTAVATVLAHVSLSRTIEIVFTLYPQGNGKTEEFDLGNNLITFPYKNHTESSG